MSILANINVRTKLIGTFILITIGTLVGAAVGSYSAQRMHRDSVDLYDKGLIPTSSIGDVMRNIHDARAQLLLALQHDPRSKWVQLHDHKIDKHLNAYEDAYDDAKAGLGAYVKQPDLDEGEKTMLADVSVGLERLSKAGKGVLNHLEAGDFDHANETILRELNPAMVDLDKAVRTVENMLIKRSQQQNQESGDLVRTISLFLWGTSGLGLVFIWAMYVYLARSITKPLGKVRQAIGKVAQGDLRTVIDGVGHSEFDELLHSVGQMQTQLRDLITEINHASQVVTDNAGLLARQIDDTARRSQEQQESMAETSAALGQMTCSIEEVSNSASGVSQASVQAKELASEGASGMDRNLKTIDRIVSQVHASNASISELCDSTKHIAELAGIIRDIADQTNLLALNAAIEAARAGEAGRGFAIVADEVRKLAERTAESSLSIGKLLDQVKTHSDGAIAAMGEVIAGVEQGASQTRSVGDTLKRILDASHEVSDLTLAIADSTRDQSTVSAQTAQSMQHVAALTDENNASIQQAAVAAEEMRSIAGRLNDLVGRFHYA